MYSLYLYFLGLSLRKTSRALVIFKDENKRSYVSVWNWIQRFGSCQVYKRKLVSAFIIDEIVIQNGNQHFWLWICIELYTVLCLESTFQRREICLLLKDSLESLLSKYGKHTLHTDGGNWYPEACNVWRLKHYVYSSFEKSLMERVNQSIF